MKLFKPFLLLFFSLMGQTLSAQPNVGTIYGKVTNNAGDPENGVHIILMQSSYGTSTTSDGFFEINAIKQGDYLLAISKVGFRVQLIPVTVTVGQDAEINVQLVEATYHLDEVAVYGQERKTIYATRLNASLEQTPLSVNIVPNELLVQQQAISLEDALRNVSGVSKFGSYGLSDNINIRGFGIGLSGGAENYRVNGVMLRTPYSDYVEEVQVLKGPASILYGDVEPGGIINFVTKKPKGYNHTSFEMKVGEHNLFRPSIDIGGKLGEKLSYRLNTVYETSESFRDEVAREQFMIAPSLTWHISEQTSLNVEGLLMNNEVTIDWGMPQGLSLERAKQLDNSNFYGYPDGMSEGDNNMLTATFQHDFGNWQIRNVMAYSNQTRLIHDVYPIYNSASDSVDFSWGDYKELSRTNTFSNFFELTGTIKTGVVRHKLMGAFDVSRISRPVAFNFNSPELSISLTNPTWENVALSSTPILNDDELPFTTRIGFNVQDLISLMDDKLNILLGGRFSQFTNGSKFRGDAEEPDDYEDTEESRFTPRVGVTYEVIDGTTLYGSYAESFSSVTPQPGRGLDEPEPLLGNQIEFGVKQSLLNERLGVTVSYFNLRRENVLQFEIINPSGSISDPNNFRANQSGEHASRGIEMDINGKLLDNWQVFAAFSYFKTEVINEVVQSGEAEPVDFAGFELPNNPNTKFSIWSQYTFENGIPGLSVGAGAFYQSDMFGDRLNTEASVIDAFTRFDAMVSYEYKNARLQLNVQNLTSEETFQRSLFGSFVPQYPRRIIGSVALKF